MKRSTIETTFIAAILALTSVLIYLCIQPGHNWGGDFALYISQSKAILNGSLFELYEQNKFSMQHSIKEIGPYLYPNGFPLLLSPVLFFFGLNFIALKFFCALFFLCSIPLIVKLFKNYFSTPIYALIITSIIAFHFEFISFTDNVLSDLPFLFFSLLSFILMQRKGSVLNSIFIGLSIFYSFFIRDIGIFMIPALVAFQFINQRIERPDKTILILPYIVFLTLFLPVYFFLPKGGSNHLNMLLAEHPGQITINLLRLFELAGMFFHVGSTFMIILIILILFGIYTGGKRTLHFAVYCFLIIVLFCLWPAFLEMRFIFPALPFLTFFLLKGIVFIYDCFKLKQIYLTILLMCFTLGMTIANLNLINEFRKVSSNQCYTEETKTIYDFIKNNTQKEDLIGYSKPAVIRLFTGRNSVFIDLDHFEGSPAKYLLQNNNTKRELQEEYEKVLVTQNYTLLKKKIIPTSFLHLQKDPVKRKESKLKLQEGLIL